MSDPSDLNTAGEADATSWVQRLLERPFVLLAAGLFVMFLFYTGWGWYEIATLPTSSLP